MKKIKLLVFMMLGISWMFQSCKEEKVQPNFENQDSQNSTIFFVKNSSTGDVIDSFDPFLLSLIKEDLEQKKRGEDANRLTQSYDMRTGKLRSQFIDEAKKVSKSSRISGSKPLDLQVNVYSWLWNYNTGIGTGITYDVPGISYFSWYQGGTTGENRCMQGFKIFADLATGNEVQYSVHRGNIGWEPYKINGQFTNLSTGGNEVQAFKIRIIKSNYNTPYYGVFYQAHVQDAPNIGYGDGWMQWTGNDSEAGTTGQSRRCEAMRVGIYEY